MTVALAVGKHITTAVALTANVPSSKSPSQVFKFRVYSSEVGGRGGLKIQY